MGNTSSEYANSHLSSLDKNEKLILFSEEYCNPVDPQCFIATEQFSWSGDDFVITDKQNVVQFQIDGKAFSFKQKKELVDKFGKNVGCLLHKHFTVHKEIKIVDNYNNVIAFARKDSMWQLSAHAHCWILPKPVPFDNFTSSNYYDRQPNLTMTGNWRTKNILFFENNSKRIVAKIQRQAMNVRNFFGKQTYECHVGANVDSALIVMLVVVLDEMYQERQR